MNNREKAIHIITSGRSSGERYDFKNILENFGDNVFNEKVQRERLSDSVFFSLQNTAKMGQELSESLADVVAVVMKEWALEKGATHFCHWFQPLTDLTAEKHDSFFVPSGDGSIISEFDGRMLIRGESDASSFPSGGLRTTFEARGYTAWDPSSPAFILGNTLVIPSLFISWAGDALDKKTPLIRSEDALNKQSLRILRLFGNKDVQRVIATVGAEQEYFLIDKQLFYLRPDMVCCGRSLFGAKSSKGQELDDHYFGTIPERVLRVMDQTEYELLKIGVPVKTRHNEVAPAQYEMTLSYQSANISVDHHMLVMDILQKVADKHGMRALFHEKPFAGINGSGKHCNWSLSTDRGENLLEPGDTPEKNARFLLFCVAVVRAVHRYSSILRMSVASAGNDHRLGMNEAPPAIVSVFLGDQLMDILTNIMNGASGKDSKNSKIMVGLSMIPKLARHSSDRNRTSPFAFTGNKFEFRAVGSSQNIARPVTSVNSIVAESLDYFATILEESVKSGEKFNEALQNLLSKAMKECSPILFGGDNYNESWVKEAEKRGLPNIRNTVDAVSFYTSKDTVSLFTKYNVLTERELASRQSIELSKYSKKVAIEARVASNVVHTMIIPAVIRYIHDVSGIVNYVGDELLDRLNNEFLLLKDVLKNLDSCISNIPEEEGEERALFLRDRVLPVIGELRVHVDRLEMLVSDKYWPLPTYHEMLFIK